MSNTQNLDKLELSKTILSPLIKLLGDLLGEVIVEQAGQKYLDLEEKIRLTAKRFREKNDLSALEELHQEIKNLNPTEQIIIVKAFSLFFQLVNLAEESYRIHRNEITAQGGQANDTIAYAIKYALENEFSLQELFELFSNLHFKLVWTAHPTEARRLTNMVKLREIYQSLEDLENLNQDSLQYRRIKNKIKESITLLWQSDPVREEKVQLLDEVRTNLFYFGRTVFDVWPEIIENLRLTIQETYLQDLKGRFLPNFIEFGSWVGGDRDGHPGVTANITIQTLLLQKRTCIRKYLDSIQDLIIDLSPSLNNVDITSELAKSIEIDNVMFQEFAGNTSRLNRLEPYRRKLDFIRIKLENTIEEVERIAIEVGLGRTLVGYSQITPASKETEIILYERSINFLEDIELIQDSLRQNKGNIIADGEIAKLLSQVRVFGFHLAPLDLRQHS